jgi:hypothetical protein
MEIHGLESEISGAVIQGKTSVSYLRREAAEKLQRRSLDNPQKFHYASSTEKGKIHNKINVSEASSTDRRPSTTSIKQCETHGASLLGS